MATSEIDGPRVTRFCTQCGRLVEALIYFYDEYEIHLLCPTSGCYREFTEDRGRHEAV